MLLDTPISLPCEDDTAHLAARLAPCLRAGDVLLLEGPVGAGKSAFARALIRALCGAETEVPSPTFTIVQTYDADRLEIWHADLYRLTNPDEVHELGLEDAFTTALCLIEWPDRLGPYRPNGALTLTLAAREDAHRLTFSADDEDWARRLGALDD